MKVSLLRSIFLLLLVSSSVQTVVAVQNNAAPAAVPDNRFECLVEPYERIEVSSEVPGIIDRIYAERGDEIRPGQKLIELRAGVEKAAVQLARAKVDFGKRKVERNEELLQKELISEHEQDELETENRIAALELEEATERLKMRTVRSPIKGVVVDRLSSPGEHVGSDPLMTLMQIDPLNIEVIVPVEKFGTIRKGMPAEIFPEIPPGMMVKGKVTIVDSVIDAASGTFGVRLQVRNKKHALAAGVKCKVRFLEK